MTPVCIRYACVRDKRISDLRYRRIFKVHMKTIDRRNATPTCHTCIACDHTDNSSSEVPVTQYLHPTDMKMSNVLIFFCLYTGVSQKVCQTSECCCVRRAQVKVGLINLCKGLFSLNARIYYKLKSGT
jgi:hypothetical protein